jgi:hypothetical protein
VEIFVWLTEQDFKMFLHCSIRSTPLLDLPTERYIGKQNQNEKSDNNPTKKRKIVYFCDEVDRALTYQENQNNEAGKNSQCKPTPGHHCIVMML